MDVNVSHFSYIAQGGAYIAARRISDSLKPYVNRSDLFVAQNSFPRKVFNKIDHLMSTLDPPPLTISVFRGNEKVNFNFDENLYNLSHLHWMPGVSNKNLIRNFKLPSVWTLHDVNAFTGVCHATFGCTEFKQNCSNCPQLPKVIHSRASEYIHSKKKLMNDLQRPIVVGPSSWICKLASESSMFQQSEIFHIPNPVPTEIFSPNQARFNDSNHTRVDKLTIGYLSESLGKAKGGFESKKLISALRQAFPTRINALEIGGSIPQEGDRFADAYVAPVSETEMAQALNLCDVMVCTSHAENFPNILIEAQACGVPVVSIDVGGARETFIHGKSGFILKDGDANQIFQAYLDNFELRRTQSRNAHLFAQQNFSFPIVGLKYFNLYQTLLNN
jgi:glycosyltransferase involved in cell wall biosynthesis